MTSNSLAVDASRATSSSFPLLKSAPIDQPSSPSPMGTRRSKGRSLNITRHHPHRQRGEATRSKIRSKVGRPFRRPIIDPYNSEDIVNKEYMISIGNRLKELVEKRDRAEQSGDTLQFD